MVPSDTVTSLSLWLCGKARYLLSVKRSVQPMIAGRAVAGPTARLLPRRWATLRIRFIDSTKLLQLPE